jgi:hypothetical protein
MRRRALTSSGWMRRIDASGGMFMLGDPLLRGPGPVEDVVAAFCVVVVVGGGGGGAGGTNVSVVGGGGAAGGLLADDACDGGAT